jgi:hypothetical protein
VPRYAAATDAATAELRDARLIVARELGFPTWRELVAGAEKSQRDAEERQERWRRLRPEADALLAGDTARLAQLTAGQADDLLQMLAMREILGTKLGEGLGVPRAAVDVLIGKATSLDLPLPQAIRSDRVEYVRLLLGAGADPGTRTNGITPLETAIYSPSTRMVDLLAEHGIVPPALWTYAACGRLDLVRACFDADGRLRPDAALPRPNVADYFPIPARNPATDDPEQIMAEAFVHACQHGRTEVVRWFLDRGLNPDVAPTSGGPAWSGRSCTSSRRWSACSWNVAPIRPAATRWFPSAPRPLWPYSSPPTSTTPWSGNSTSCSGPGRAEPPSQVVVRVSRCWCGH